MPFDPKTEEIIKRLPAGADVAHVRAALTKLAIEYQHVPARDPDGYQWPNLAVHELIPFLAGAQDDPAFAQRAKLLQRALADLLELRDLIERAMQGEKQRRERFYAALLRIWSDASGKKPTVGDSKAGSPCARYLKFAVEAITGEKLSISGARKIILRQRS
jgi:hypothetical protein